MGRKAPTSEYNILCHPNIQLMIGSLHSYCILKPFQTIHLAFIIYNFHHLNGELGFLSLTLSLACSFLERHEYGLSLSLTFFSHSSFSSLYFICQWTIRDSRLEFYGNMHSYAYFTQMLNEKTTSCTSCVDA